MLLPRALRLAAATLGAACLFAVPRARAQAPAAPLADSTAVRMRAIVDAGQHPGMRWPRLVDVGDDLRALYAPAGGAPLWSRDGRPTPAALATIERLAVVDADGLRPEDYDAGTLRRLAGARSMPPLLTAEQRAAFDVALSADAARLLRALRYGRLSATAAHAELRFPREPFDVVGSVRALAAGADPAAVIARAEPPYLHYRLLRDAMARYRALGRDTTLLPLALRIPLRAGASDPGVPRLRRLLRALGDAPDSGAVAPADSTRYDGALVAAVRHFQRRQGADADGIVGRATLARLQLPFDVRVEQIALTLERWRWLPHVITDPPVVVNVPAFRLHAFRTSSDREADILSMDVVVGDAFDHRTPVLSATMRYLVFAPYWDVPPSIARAEILPRARRDPAYLDREDFEIVDDRERVLPSTGASIAAVAAGRARVRQRPGPTNALGRVKFIFPNAHDVYLHDTPVQSAFGRARRDLSHGCVRVAEPARLAEFVLRGQPGWDSARVAAAMTQTRPQRVDLARPVPVHIVYATAVAREDGSVFFYEDIYRHDAALARLLAGGYPYAAGSAR